MKDSVTRLDQKMSDKCLAVKTATTRTKSKKDMRFSATARLSEADLSGTVCPAHHLSFPPVAATLVTKRPRCRLFRHPLNKLSKQRTTIWFLMKIGLDRYLAITPEVRCLGRCHFGGLPYNWNITYSPHQP